MPKKRNPKGDEPYQIWLKSKGNKLLKDIAKEVGGASSTLRKWESQDSWDYETERSE
ncbi:phage terminase small subunit-related protein [Alkalibacterium putridalgicola]|uniref:phage terminase small subunit-related protein n=1 Tax=Alkalibacterium putridalgicola TaxID=426703 RepID=UPI0034CF467F